ncbi:MAG: DUF4976 domain-containing protein, partial [Pirellulaceae bacterium]|nr:DUF4976 domain-containing protein [Pirellulaceae bacterium]
QPHQHLDGVSLMPLLTSSDRLKRNKLFWHFPHYNKHPSSHPSSVIRQGDWKLIETFDPPGVELFNLNDDLGEMNNLAQTMPNLRDELLKELQAWREEVGAESMSPNPNYSAPKPTDD